VTKTSFGARGTRKIVTAGCSSRCSSASTATCQTLLADFRYTAKQIGFVRIEVSHADAGS